MRALPRRAIRRGCTGLERHVRYRRRVTAIAFKTVTRPRELAQMKPFSRNSERCPNCQAKLAASTLFCGSCGAEVPAAETTPAADEPNPKSRRQLARIAAIAASVLLVLGLAGGIAAKIRHDNAQKKEQAQRIAAKKKAAAKLRVAKAEYDECQAEESDLLDQLSAVNARLDVGMNFSDYSDTVSDISVEYSKSDSSDLGIDCLGEVAVPAEVAVREHVRAARKWSHCFDDIDCDPETVDLQSYWSRATDKTTDASDALAALEPR